MKKLILALALFLLPSLCFAAEQAKRVTFTPAGTIAATNVQSAIEEVASEAGGAGYTWTAAGDSGAGFLVGDANETVTLKGGGINTVSAAGNVWTVTGTEVDPTVDTSGEIIAIIGYTPSYQWTAAGDSGTPFLVGNTAETVTLKGAGINTVAAGSNVWTITGTEVDPTVDTAAEIKAILGDIALTTETSGNYVASVATTAPLTGGAAGSEGATLTIAIPKADTSTNGYLWSTDWNTFNNKQATIANYVGTVADGTGIDGTATGAGSTYTPTFDATELGNLTWGSGATAGITWTWDLSGTDTAMTWSAGNVGIGTTSPDVALSVYPDTDNKAKIGRALISYEWGSDTATFGHIDMTGDTRYALGQHSNGTVILNTPLDKAINFRSNGITTLTMLNNKVGIGTMSPTAILHLKAGSATASTAPIKLTSGTVLTTPEAGTFEYDGTNLYFTP